MKKVSSPCRFVFFLGLLCLSMIACRKTGGLVGMNLENPNVEEQKIVGDAIKEHVLTTPNKFPVLDSIQYADAYHYINSLFHTLLRTANVSRRDMFDWDITILEDDSYTTSFITPGGHLFIYTGLLKFISSENELLSVLAHEIFYADSDFAVRKLLDEIDGGGSTLGDIVIGNDVEDMTAISCHLRDLEFSQNTVIQADNYAIDLICPFQYDASGLETLILDASQSPVTIDWFVRSPFSFDRLDNIKNRIGICGTDEVTHETRYQKFLFEDLP